MRTRFEWEEGAEGAVNMGCDEAMLDDAARGAPPTLRLYRWARPTLSLGHSQTLERAADADALRRLAIPWVRRPTGGRALLHQPDELTYAFAAGREVAPGVRRGYRRVMRALRTGLAAFAPLDPPPEQPTERDRSAPRLPCFAVPSGHELTVGGRKLVAGAQRWRRGAFLQHGSIPWTIACDLTNEAVGLPPESPIHAVGLAEISAEPPSLEAVALSLSAAFSEEFRVSPVLV